MTTIVIPRATAKAEALAENIAKLQDAESQLAEKLKKVGGLARRGGGVVSRRTTHVGPRGKGR